jgi:pimeloyl-ACP methyl ester carboxylesterase
MTSAGPRPAARDRAPLVLVHGGSTTGRCWDRLIPHLDRPALAVDLPGRPGCEADHRTVTIASGALSVLEQMDAAAIARATLVGHSLSGVTLVRVAELAPHRVQRLVFIACVVPPDGKRPVDVLLPAHQAHIAALLDQEEATIPSRAADPLAAESDNGDGGRINLVPEAAGPFGEAVSLAGLRQGISCTFVKLEDDSAQTPEIQDRTVATIRNVCPSDVISVRAGHMAMYSHPRLLADALNHLLD